MNTPRTMQETFTLAVSEARQGNYTQFTKVINGLCLGFGWSTFAVFTKFTSMTDITHDEFEKFLYEAEERKPKQDQVLKLGSKMKSIPLNEDDRQ